MIHIQFSAKPGVYESYWTFYDGEKRFGNWLCCRIIVDDPILSLNTECKYGSQNVAAYSTPPVVEIEHKSVDQVKSDTGKWNLSSLK